MGVVSRGAVRSILLFSNVPIPEIRRIAVDQSSRSAAAMMRIVLPLEGAGELDELRVPPTARLHDLATDALLLIGDAALRHPLDAPFMLDLGAAWQIHFGLPFVYAMWIGRDGVDLEGLQPRLMAAKERGVARRETIARRAARVLGLPEPLCLQYLTRHIHYDVGPEELEGLFCFGAEAAKLDVARRVGPRL